MSEIYEFDRVDFVTAGAVGEPGDRTFYVQAETEGERVAVIVEKGQVRSLSQLAQELLSRSGVVVTPDDLDVASYELREPIEPLWRASSMSLAIDEDAERFLLEIAEMTDDDDEEEPGQVRLWMTQEQLGGLAAYAAYAVEAGARETCRHCGRPMSADGHVCPSMNGHGPLPF